jgi:hypothetical protein
MDMTWRALGEQIESLHTTEREIIESRYIEIRWRADREQTESL